jgi:hypothetical protein
VQENQTSAFTVNASDSNGNTLTYSISGDDSSLLSISTAGLVTLTLLQIMKILVMQIQTISTRSQLPFRMAA